MKKSINLLSIILLSTLMVVIGNGADAQEIQKKKHGISISFTGSGNGFQLKEDWEDANDKRLYKGSNVFIPKYGFEYAVRKRGHFVSRFGIGYMPSFTKYYNSSKNKNDDDWTDFESTLVKVDLTCIDLHLINTWRINLYQGNYHILLGFGLGVGHLDMKFDENDKHTKQFITGSAFPLAGLDIDLGSWITFFAQYQYLFGATSNRLSKGESAYDCSFILKGPEINFGVNIYF